MADFIHRLNEATAMLDEVWDMTPISVESRFAGFADHITRTTPFKGGALHKKFINQSFTRVQADSDLEADMPAPGAISTLDVEIQESDLRRLSFSMQKTEQAGQEVDGSEDAVWDLATELKADAEEAMREKDNRLVHEAGTAAIGTIAQQYATSGASYSQATTCFLQITDAPISAFKMGQILEINSVDVKVTDVEEDTHWGNSRTNGPGIFVALYADEGEGTTHLDALTAGQTIKDKGDAAAGGYGLGLAALCTRYSGSALAYFSVTDRQAAGYRFLLTKGRSWLSGTPVALNVDTHFGEMAIVMGQIFGPAQAYRRNRGFQMANALVGVAQPELLDEAAKQCGDSSLRFSKQTFTSTDEAAKAKLVAQRGWTGVVITSAGFPHPIILQPDQLATPNTIRITDPSAFEWITFGGKKPKWLSDGGVVWHRMWNTTTNRLTMKAQAGGYVIKTLFCEQPKAAVYSIEGVKSSLR